VDAWNIMLATNDLVNANTGELDPRHMYGVTNQDVFRWPAIKDGTQKMLLGIFITTFLMPGIPLLLWDHINDYHGAVAPLYLLPQKIPVVLSLHNADFRGVWPKRTKQEALEISRIFNLDKSLIETYVQFGESFNLLHGAASYLRLH